MMKRKTVVLLFTAVFLSILNLSVLAGIRSEITYDYGAASVRSEYIINSNPHEYTEKTFTALSEPVCEGFEFDGWYLEPEYITKTESITEDMTGDITLYAKWYEMSYSITYVLTTPGIPITSTEVTNPNVHIRLAGEEVFLSAPQYISDTYSFDGWYLDSDYTERIEVIDEYTCKDLTLYAHWINSQFSIQYDLGDIATGVYPVNNPNPQAYEYGTELNLSPAVTDDPAYTFEGWYTDAFFSEKTDTIKAGTHGNITLYAKWKKNEYKVNYVLTDNSSVSEASVTNNNPDTRTADADFILFDPESSNKSFCFAGWFTSADFEDSARITKIKAGTTGDITLYAKWEKAVYKITYNFGKIDTYQCPVQNGNPTEYEFGDSFKLSDVSANGFIFNGWCTDEKLKNHVTEITSDMYGDITLYADFTEKTYTINYVVEDENVTASQVVNTSPTVRTTTERVYFDDAQTINIDYKFDGWYFDPEFKKEATFIKAYTAENVTVYAKWVRIVTYVPVWGDATLSEQLSAADARLILRYSAGLETFSELQLKISDINNDSAVNAADARLALRLSAGIDKEEELIEKYGLPEIKLEDGEIIFR